MRGTHLARQKLDHLPHRHPGREPVRIHDGVCRCVGVSDEVNQSPPPWPLPSTERGAEGVRPGVVGWEMGGRTRHDALVVERHVLLVDDEAAHALLPVAR